jgi:signal transduction histidine kinase
MEIENKNTAQSKALSTKYEKEKTEKEIQRYKNEQLTNQYKLMGLSALLVFILILSGVIAYIFIQRSKNKKLIDQINQAHEKKLIEQETKEKERNRISRNLHDNLGAYASSILNKIKMIESDVDTQFKGAELIELRHTAQQILYNLKSIVIDLNQKSLPFLEFMDQLKTELIRLFNAYPQIELSITEQIEFDPMLSPESQFNIKSILFEIINNALKHSQASMIHLFLEESSADILIKVEDNGRYHQAIEDSAGNGIANIQSRVTILGGRVRFLKNEFGGTSVLIEIPKNLVAS